MDTSRSLSNSMITAGNQNQDWFSWEIAFSQVIDAFHLQQIIKIEFGHILEYKDNQLIDN